MLLSILIHLEAQAEGQIDQFTGRGVHGFWFNRWREVDSALGDELHESNDAQPFTLSPLILTPRPAPAGRGVGMRVKPGTAARFRITSLTEALSEAVQSKWLDGLEEKGAVEIPQPKDEDPGVPWKVTRAEVKEQAAYEALSKIHLMNSVPPREWHLDFLTPTTFHGTNGHLPFPLPDSLVNSWMRRWNAFAPIALPKDDLLEWTRQKLVVSSYRLRTAPAREGERLRVGCVGSLTLRALDMPPYLRAAVDLLAHYASFCGSGTHTAQGMGQTQMTGRRSKGAGG
jgi:CRISPR-associated endoribonuclease Cas6